MSVLGIISKMLYEYYDIDNHVNYLAVKMVSVVEVTNSRIYSSKTNKLRNIYTI